MADQGLGEITERQNLLTAARDKKFVESCGRLCPEGDTPHKEGEILWLWSRQFMGRQNSGKGIHFCNIVFLGVQVLLGYNVFSFLS